MIEYSQYQMRETDEYYKEAAALKRQVQGKDERNYFLLAVVCSNNSAS